MNDTAFDIRDELLHLGIVQVLHGQIFSLARARVRFGNQRHDAAVAKIGMRVPKLERAEFGITIGIPALA